MNFSKELKSNKNLENLFRLAKIKSCEHLYQYLLLLEKYTTNFLICMDAKFNMYISEPHEVIDIKLPGEVNDVEIFRNLSKVLCDKKNLVKENDTGTAYFIDFKNIYFIEYIFVAGKFKLILVHIEYEYYPVLALVEHHPVTAKEETETLDNLVIEARKIAIEHEYKRAKL
jgi:hypothetical protein